MNHNFCYRITSFDQKASEVINVGKNISYSPRSLTTLRSLYDNYATANNLPLINIDTTDESVFKEEVRKLEKYKEKIDRNIYENITNLSMPTYKEAYEKLRDEDNGISDPKKRIEAANCIADLFSAFVDHMLIQYPSLSREIIISGFMSNGVKQCGQNQIFQHIYNVLLEDRQEYVEKLELHKNQLFFTDSKLNKLKERIADYDNILNNFSSVLPFVRAKLKEIEGIKLGQTEDYAIEVNELDFENFDISDIFSAEESEREAWQKVQDSISAFSTLTAEVRSVISRIRKRNIDNGEVELNHLGRPINMEAMEVHQKLIEMLQYSKTKSQMMDILKKESENSYNPDRFWVKELYDKLNANPVLQTKFRLAFRKNFIPYILMKIKKTGVYLKTYTISANKKINNVYAEVLTAIQTGRSFSSTIGKAYNIEGKITNDFSNFNQFIENSGFLNGGYRSLAVSEIDGFSTFDVWINEDTSTVKIEDDTPFIWTQLRTQKVDKQNKIAQIADFIYNSSRFLGIDMSAEEASAIARNNYNRKEILKNIVDLYVYYTSKKGVIKPGSNYLDLFKNTSEGKESVFSEKIRKITNILYKIDRNKKSQHRAIVKDSKGNTKNLNSDVLPSYMADKIEDIAFYVKNEDKNGLKEYLETEFKFGKSDIYATTNKNGTYNIPNIWLRELYRECLTAGPFKPNGFASKFSLDRFIGGEDKPFDNYTIKEHALSVITRFIDHFDSSYASYQSFILGDSNISKYLVAPRYGKNAVINHLYELVESEKNRMYEAAVLEADMAAKKFSGLQNYTARKNEFTLLKFLNEPYIDSAGNEKRIIIVNPYDIAHEDDPIKKEQLKAQNSSEKEIKEAITYHLEKMSSEYIEEMQKLGILEYEEHKDESGKITNNCINFEGKSLDFVKSQIKDFVYNHYLATACQLQIFDVDTSFAKNSDDLQKRNKQNHASGTPLDIKAVDPSHPNIRISPNGREKCLYIDDIKMEPKKQFMEFVKEVIGEDSEGYSKYKEDTSLTDGQGWRTLNGYKKVMVMSGLWTTEMENAYREITKYTRISKNRELTKDELVKLYNISTIFQPIKPFVYTKEEYHYKDEFGNDKTAIIPVQHKYSECVVIPILLEKDSPLKHVIEYAEQNSIDMVCATSCVKIGSWGSVNLKEVTSKEDINTSLQAAAIHELKYEDYKIQTNTPYHGNQSNLIGTQGRKITISHSIKRDKYGNIIDTDYSSYVGGNQVSICREMVDLKNDNLPRFYNSIVVAQMLDSLKEFISIVKNPEKLSQILGQGVVNNGREPIDNIVAYSLQAASKVIDGTITDETSLKEFMIPLFEGALEYNSAAQLFSIFRKIVNKQTIKGGSFVQASAYGITDGEIAGNLESMVITDKDGNKNILYAECEVPFDLTVKVGNQDVQLNYEDWCNPKDHSLITREVTTEELSKMNESEKAMLVPYSIKDENGNIVQYRKAIIEDAYPNILDILAYRIPTEREYSMLNLRVKRFTPKSPGGTIKVPLEYTTIAGFDFD